MNRSTLSALSFSLLLSLSGCAEVSETPETPEVPEVPETPEDLDFDNDGIVDAEDRDDDNDGLSDEKELAIGTDPNAADTDGDGFGDLEEQIIHEQCLLSPETCNGDPDPLDPSVGVSSDDFVFVLPFFGPEESGQLSFTTDIKIADIHFSMDTTTSMNGEIANLKAGVQTIISEISDPAGGIPDTAFGVSRFEDFAQEPFGEAGNLPFQLHQAITTDPASVQAGVNALFTRGGGSVPESGFEALYQIATGEGIPGVVPAFTGAHEGSGGVGFRQGALPIVVQITDASSHAVGISGTCGGEPLLYRGIGAHSKEETIAALQEKGTRVIGIAAENFLSDEGCRARGYLEEVATATGARVPPSAFTAADGSRPAGCAADQCCTGPNGAGLPVDAEGLCPLVFQLNNNGLEQTSLIVTALKALVGFAGIDISAAVKSAPQDAANGQSVDPASFIRGIEPVAQAGQVIDAVNGRFLKVQPGTDVAFALRAKNDFVPQAAEPQVFTLQIEVVGDEVTTLDTRQVVIIVPAASAAQL